MYAVSCPADPNEERPAHCLAASEDAALAKEADAAGDLDALERVCRALG